jgi:hypothetical protein
VRTQYAPGWMVSIIPADTPKAPASTYQCMDRGHREREREAREVEIKGKKPVVASVDLCENARNRVRDRKMIRRRYLTDDAASRSFSLIIPIVSFVTFTQPARTSKQGPTTGVGSKWAGSILVVRCSSAVERTSSLRDVWTARDITSHRKSDAIVCW